MYVSNNKIVKSLLHGRLKNPTQRKNQRVVQRHRISRTLAHPPGADSLVRPLSCRVHAYRLSCSQPRNIALSSYNTSGLRQSPISISGPRIPPSLSLSLLNHFSLLIICLRSASVQQTPPIKRLTLSPSPHHRNHGDLYHRLLYCQCTSPHNPAPTPISLTFLLQLMKYMSLDQKGSAMAE